MYVDARSNSGLMINEKLASGVTFRILDVIGGKVILVANLISLKTFPLSLLCITKHKYCHKYIIDDIIMYQVVEAYVSLQNVVYESE